MSDLGSSSSHNQQGQHQHDGTGQSQRQTQAPQPPPFNPLPSHHSQVGSSLGHSVVPDLMKVYESLTHSSTPQVPPPQLPAPHQTMAAPPNVPSTQYSSQPIPQQQQNAQFPQPSQCSMPQPPQTQQQPQYQQQTQYFQPQPQAYNTLSQDTASSYIHQQGSAATPEPYFDRQPQDPSPQTSRTPDENVRGRRPRKRSQEGTGSDTGESQSKGRKKGSQSDGRWSKRFSWPEDLHRDFVSAVFDVGLKHSSPSALMEFMPKHDQITSERIKSHLQKYRLHRAKSKKEFMSSYDASLSKFQVGGIENNVKSLSSGEVAAHLTYSTLSENESPAQEATKMGASETLSMQNKQGGVLYLPQLTDTEKQSPVGASMGYLMGLFFSLRQQLMKQRAESGLVVPNPQGHTNTATGLPVVTDAGPVNVTVSAVQSSVLAGTIGNQQPHQHQAPNSDITVTWSTPHAGQPINAQQPQHQQTFSTHTDSSQETSVEAKVHQAAQQLISPSTRSNVEENNLMKREMKSQMAFQNKMRALKQQELNKYKNMSTGVQQVSHDTCNDGQSDEGKGAARDGHTPDFVKPGGGDSKDAGSGAIDTRSQYAGQTAGTSSSTVRNAARGVSFGTPEDFWNSGDVDDHLFEFLMNT